MNPFLQSDPSLKPKDRLIFALDYPTLKEAEKAVRILDGRVGLFKVGLELFVGSGPVVFKAIADHSDSGIFLDLKFHDIPETVLAAVQAASAYPVRFITVHASEGKRAIAQVVRGVRSDIKVIAVTVLTSVTGPDMRAAGIDAGLDLQSLALLRARDARAAGCSGVVCSGMEARNIKKNIGKEWIVVVPGIRPKGTPVTADDQERITTPRQAVLNGADYIVVGRPIRKAPDPARAADEVVEEIRIALEHETPLTSNGKTL